MPTGESGVEMDFTKKQVEDEIKEKAKDLEVFWKARELIRARVLEVAESECRLTPLPNWSGTDAVLGSLDLAIHSMERTLEELRNIRVEEPVARPTLRIVRSDDEH